jgi:hypothetical protein
MISNRLARGLLLSGLFAGASVAAQAVLLIPPVGTTPLPGTASSTLPTLTGGTLLASISDTFSTASYSGVLYTAVIRETTGTLDFLYQVKATAGPDFIHRVTTVNFTGFSTDVDYLSDPFIGFGFVAPVVVVSPVHPYTADRQTADTVGFNFQDTPSGNQGLQAGDTSNVFYIRTNALNYAMGDTNVIDGNIARVTSFAPTALPGPAAVIPMALGLLVGLRRRKR